MNLYEKQIEKELDRWYGDIIKSANLFQRASGGLQKTTQKMVPRKIQNTITIAIKGITQTILTGSELLSITDNTDDLSLAERDYLVLHIFKTYRTAALAQGIGFGMGGILLGLADLPVLLGIKVKFLFDAAKLYGYDPESPEERLFLLYVFQLAFSGKEHRLKIFRILEKWDQCAHPVMDWEKFQVEYRDYIDIAKLLQLLPVIGSVAGGTANHNLMNRLCENVMNCYRIRILKQTFPIPKAPSLNSTPPK